MNDVTTEQKLQLVQQIRAKYNENRYDMYNREQILYGRAAQNHQRPESSKMPSSFRFRLLLSVILVVLLYAMDVNEISLAGITTEKIAEMISADYENRIDEWVASFSSAIVRFENIEPR